MEYSEILYEVRDPMAVITLNNPTKANALSRNMVRELAHALGEVSGNESVRVLIIRAAGKHFCAGHYLPEMTGKGVREYQDIFDSCTEMMQMIHDLPQPVIAQVQGVATAAGCQLAAWCDMVVAEEGARFATPGVKIGLFCTTPGVAIVRAIGRKAAMEMLLTGRYFPAQEAKDLGLVNRVVPAEKLMEETEALALQVAKASRYVLAVGKQAFYAQVDKEDDAAYAVGVATMTMNLCAEDAQAGITAFIDKKEPSWKDR